MPPAALGSGSARTEAPTAAGSFRRGGLARSFVSFVYHDFRWYWYSTFAAFMAMQIQMVTRGWLVYDLTKSPMALALVVVSFGAPMAALSLIGGALADRLPKRKLIIVIQLANGISAFVVAFLVFQGVIELWHLLVTGVFNGALIALSNPARQSMVPMLVPREHLVNGIGLSTSGMNVSRIAGPALAGGLIPFIGVGGVYIGIGVLNLFASLIMLRVTITGQSVVDKAHWKMRREVLRGVKYVMQGPALRALLLLSLFAVLLGMPFQNLLPAFAVEALSVGAGGLGVLMALTGVGAVVGSVIVASLGGVKRKGVVLMASAVAWAVSVVLFSFSTSFLVAGATIIVIGFASSIFMALNMSLLQLLSAQEMHGRVVSVSMMTFGLMPVGVLPISALAEATGTPAALGIAGLLLVAVTLVYLLGNRTIRSIRA